MNKVLRVLFGVGKFQLPKDLNTLGAQIQKFISVGKATNVVKCFL